MKERLKKVRVTLGYNLQEISDILGIPLNTYIGYEYRTKNVPLDFLISLNNNLNININWLLTGNGEMLINSCGNSLKKSDNESIVKKNVYIGKRLIQIQEKNNLLDKDMAKILEMYRDDYIDLKLGNKEPTFKIINKIKQSFDISIDWLLYGD